jgi:hypothetical protein
MLLFAYIYVIFVCFIGFSINCIVTIMLQKKYRDNEYKALLKVNLIIKNKYESIFKKYKFTELIWLSFFITHDFYCSIFLKYYNIAND